MVTCGVCGETANPGSIFCRRCGAELPRRGVPVSDAQTTVLPVVPTADPAANPPGYGPPGNHPQASPPRHGAPDVEAQRQPPVQPPSQQSANYPAGQQPTSYQPPTAGYQPSQPRPAGYQPPPPAGYQPPPASYQPDQQAPVFLPPDERPPSEPGHRNRTLFAIIGGVVVLVLVAFGIAIALLSKDNSKNGVAQPVPSATRTAASSNSASASPTAATTSPKPTPKPTPTVNKLKAAQTAALTQLGGLVGTSGSARSGIGAAVSQINSCKNIPQAVSTLKNAAQTRRTLAGRAGKLNLGSIPSGPQLIASFRSSMQASALADENYANWGEHVQGCKKSPPSKPALKVAENWDSQATTAKTTFANQYNAVARTLGLPGTSAGSF